MWITTQSLPRYPVSKSSPRERKLLETLEHYILGHEKDITSILLRLWRDQMIVLTLKTAGEWVNRRDVTDADMKDFRGDYQRLAENQLAPMWRRIMDDAVSPENPQFDWAEKYSRGGGGGRAGGSDPSGGGFTGSVGGFSGFGGGGSGGGSGGLPTLFPREFSYHPQKDGVKNWIENHTAELVTNATEEQKKAIKAVLAHGTEHRFSVEETAREIKRTVGLNGRQAAANEKYYSHVKDRLAKDHPNMLPEDIEAEARGKADSYKKKQISYRARMIARTEIGNAYNAGALYGVHQAIDDGLIASATKVWVTSRNEANMCPGCAALEGVEIPLDEYFNYNGSQILAPLAHPNGKCTLEFKVREAENPILESGDIEEVEFVEQDSNGMMYIQALSRTYVNKKDLLYRNLEKVKALEGYEDFGVHGTPESIIVDTTNGQETEYTAREFADVLRADPQYHNGNIRLLSCSTGFGDNGFAQQLANELNVDVMAQVLWVGENGELFISNNEILSDLWYNNGNIDNSINQTGEWRVFHPKRGESI